MTSEAIQDSEMDDIERFAVETELNQYAKSNKEEKTLVLSPQEAKEQPSVGDIIESVALMKWKEMSGNEFVGTSFLAKLSLGQTEHIGLFTAGHNLIDAGTKQLVNINLVKLKFRHIRNHTKEISLTKLMSQKHLLVVAYKKSRIFIKDGWKDIQPCRDGLDFTAIIFTSPVDDIARFLRRLGLSFLKVGDKGSCGSSPDSPVSLVGFPQYIKDSPMRFLPGNELQVPKGDIPDHCYTLETEPGASGGSVSDKGGRVIAIHIRGLNPKKGHQGNWGLGFDLIREELLQCISNSSMISPATSVPNITQGVSTIQIFLKKLNLEKYSPRFEEEDVDLDVLMDCDQDEMKEILEKVGATFGATKQIRKALDEEKCVKMSKEIEEKEKKEKEGTPRTKEDLQVVRKEKVLGKERNIDTPKWQPNSCIIVLGTTGRGKSTTVNIYTGNNIRTGGASHSTTKGGSYMYHDKLLEHQVGSNEIPYPKWMDTEGLDAFEAYISNGQLVKSYLECLQKNKIERVHAIIWNITPEEKLLKMIVDQAAVIKQILGDIKENIWKNVIIIAKGGNSHRDFQGPLKAVSVVEKKAAAALEKGYQSFEKSIQCLQYSLDVDDSDHQIKMARSKIHQALCNIDEPIQVIFQNKVCLDCGQRGDERLLTDLCHEEPITITVTKWFVNVEKQFCSCCKKEWTSKCKIFGHWKFNKGEPCVRIRNPQDIKAGETLAKNKKTHNMVDIP